MDALKTWKLPRAIELVISRILEARLYGRSSALVGRHKPQVLPIELYNLCGPVKDQQKLHPTKRTSFLRVDGNKLLIKDDSVDHDGVAQ
jgi:hypothetical protein